MPNMGFDAQEARLVEWLKEPGDEVSRGEAIALVESDKANVDLESVAAGVLLEQLVSEDSSVEVGTVIARVGTREEYEAAGPGAETAGKTDAEASTDRTAQAAVDADAAAGPTAEAGVHKATPPPADRAAAAPAGPVRALPKVRKQARELGVDLAKLHGTGPAGAITMADVEAAAGLGTASGAEEVSPLTGGPSGEAERLSKTRQAIAERMTRSVREAPQFNVGGEIDLEDALPRLSETLRMNDLLLYLTVQALREVPVLNAHFDGTYLTRYPQVDLSIAVAGDDGLLTPTIPGAERLTPAELAEASRAVIARARSGRQRREDLTTGTFTVSNLGITRRVDRFTAVLNPPQVAILAAGSAKPRPVVRDGGLHMRTTVQLTLTGDHRVVDGVDLARFLDAFQAQVEELARA